MLPLMPVGKLHLASLVILPVEVQFMLSTPPGIRDSHISTKSSKPLPIAFGETEKQGFKVFGSFQLGLPSKVPQTP